MSSLYSHPTLLELFNSDDCDYIKQTLKKYKYSIDELSEFINIDDNELPDIEPLLYIREVYPLDQCGISLHTMDVIKEKYEWLYLQIHDKPKNMLSPSTFKTLTNAVKQSIHIWMEENMFHSCLGKHGEIVDLTQQLITELFQDSEAYLKMAEK